ncbi:hypothetical protein P154DRAFT_306280 [Amniculicola lignicola CBS 123094]|uniref:Uncharacterized protein n=1 Tax=Amniculicola lignicola CBS 123094 TaxID=1392246 RepID=A0A6A5W7C7_9PLEO|nr:hypothetical protein P154DRAFT_306280 [Amniculicola lignicola CBS 123094]
MKRAFASPKPCEFSDDNVNTIKRWKSHNTNESSHDFERAFKRRRSDTPPLTQEVLDKLRYTTESKSLEEWAADCTQSVLRWAYKCESSNELEMPPSPTPSVTPSRGNQRRTAKLVQRQRSSSPVKKANSPQYRAMNMADANVFVDHFPEAPATIDEQLGYIFDGATWVASQLAAVEELARQYCEESRVLAKKCAGENEWRSQLFLGLLQPLSRHKAEILMLSASEKREFVASTVRADTNCNLG